MKNFLLLLVFTFLAVSCNAQEKNGYSTEEFIKLKNEKKDLVLLDVRTPQELVGELGKIDGVINIPLNELEQRLDELKQYKDKEIIVVCRSGRRSDIGTGILQKHGFNAMNLEGGMLGYRNAEVK